ncbi:T9SS type A sorting domain-containing protein [Chryseobacterium fluminis]|uniref:T9SS type A sorting domain-containing protein n=1 Tax=Chryseobacterium fluminis TaxID=2983606 RepID=UPI00225AD69E|nr:T9SS type A sorting domain-containing protein [Chryseobacterium sp. MMS21-Ot14]UZT96791.1 T9SS type A sorting domain-containing protein [Chryseobacterium sp. MMS21-Ot14]
MKKILFLILIQVCIFNFAQTQNLDWQLVSPFLRQEDVMKMETLPDGSYLAKKSNSNYDLIITENNGKTWRQINDNGKSVYDFTIYNNKGYAVIGPDFRVTDSKFSTPGVSYPFTGSTQSIFVLNDNIIFVSSGNSRMHKSTNGGATWTSYLVPTVYQDKITSVYFTDANTGFCVSDSTIGDSFIFKTTDGGQTWTKVNTSSVEFRKIIFKDSMNGIATRYGGNPLYTLDGGNTWTEAAGVGTLNDIKLYNNQYIAIGNPNKFYRTATGESWTDSGDMYPSSFHVFTSLSIHPNFILAGTNNESGSSTLRHTIFKSTDLLTWTPLNMKWIYWANYQQAYAGDNLTIVPFNYFSLDKGYSWEAVKNNFPAGAMSINPDGKGIAIGRSTSQFWKTNDNGLTWTEALSPNLRLTIPAMKPNGDFAIANLGTNANSYTGYISTYSAANGWTPPVNVEWEVSALKFVDNNVGFLVNRDKVKKTTDGGLTWTDTTYPGAILDARNIVVGNSKVYIGKYYTTNLGSAWTQVPSQMLSFKDYDIFSDGLGYAVDGDKNVYKTLNYGSSWQKIINTQLLLTPGSLINKVTFARNYMVAVGYSGFYILDFVTGNLSTNDPKLEVNTNKIKIYPNPSSSTLFFDSKDEIKNITVFDISGRVFKNIQNPTSNSIDISDLHNGNYFVKFISADKTYLEKVIKN